MGTPCGISFGEVREWCEGYAIDDVQLVSDTWELVWQMDGVRLALMNAKPETVTAR